MARKPTPKDATLCMCTTNEEPSIETSVNMREAVIRINLRYLTRDGRRYPCQAISANYRRIGVLAILDAHKAVRTVDNVRRDGRRARLLAVHVHVREHQIDPVTFDTAVRHCGSCVIRLKVYLCLIVLLGLAAVRIHVQLRPPPNE